MNFAYSEEQNLLRQSIARFIRENHSFQQRQTLLTMEDEQAKLWKKMADLGWLALLTPENDGGLGGSKIDLIILMEEFGKGLMVTPYLAAIVLAATALSQLGSDEQKEQLLTPLLTGEKTAAFAFLEAQSRYDLLAVQTTSEETANGYLLNGNKSIVFNGCAADFIIVSAKDSTTGEIQLYWLDRKADGIKTQPYETSDRFAAAELSFQKTPAQRLNPTDSKEKNSVRSHTHVLEFLADLATLALCAEALGAMEILYQSTVSYAKERNQFGVPISSFQVLQHRMVDMYIHYEKTKSLLMMATLTVENTGLSSTDIKSRQKAISALKVQTALASKFVGQQAVQIHGGMGMTEELAIGHYFKRLTMISMMFGNEDFHLARFAAAS